MNIDWNHRPGMGKHMSLKAPPTRKEAPAIQTGAAEKTVRPWLRCLGGLAIVSASAYTFTQGGLSRQALGVLGVGAGSYLCWSAR